MQREQPEWRALLRLALPLMVVNLGSQLMGVVDTALSGRIDALAQAAAGLGNTVFFLGALFGIGVAMGVDPMTSQAFGAGRPRAARRAMWQCIWIAAAVSVPVALVIFAIGRLLEPVGISAELAVETRRYLDARLASVLPLLLLTAVRGYLQSAHRMRPIVVGALVANLFNLVADWVLVFGDDGLVRLGVPAIGVPAFGVAGIGWATTVATVLNLLLFARGAADIEAGEADARQEANEPLRRPEARLVRRALVVGVPIGLHMLAEIGVFSLAGFLAGTMGAVTMAAHQVALQLVALTFMVPLALGAAIAVRVGNAVGRAEPDGVRRAGTAGIAMAAVFMSLSAVSMWTMTASWARLMTSDARVLPLACELIVIAGAFQIFDGVQAAGAGALRGMGLTGWTMAANVIAYWIIGCPLLLWLGLGLDFGVHGVWWGLTIGLMVAAVLLTGKFRSVSRGPIAALQVA